jgi:23S rRNA G2069 N7-methylase RlmK/C1962 C5-methylase RlmI
MANNTKKQCEKFYESMLRRCRAVLAARGAILLSSSQRLLNRFAFNILALSVYMMKVIPETQHFYCKHYASLT